MTTASALQTNYRSQQSALVSVDGRTYPLKSANINARAEGGIAATTLTQAYENPYAEALEVLYTLPLPADGAVTGYTIRLGKRVIRAEVQKREEARAQYRKALLDGRAAALLEQERADTFSQWLGSLPPGETAIVEIEVLQPLAFLPATKNGQACWEYRFPMVAGVRYEGDENRVPDAGKLDVNRAAEGLPVTLEATLLIADGAADQIKPYAPDQKLQIQGEEKGTRVALERGMPLNRDLVIRWAAGDQEAGVRAAEGKGLPCDNGRYLLMTLTPPNAVSAGIARDLTLLIDSSGSMEGQPLEQAKTVAVEMLRSLDTGDRFEVLAFSNNVRQLVSGPREASEKNVEGALKEISKLRASGGTEMTRALTEALTPLRPDSQRQIILLSDGYIGFEREVIGEIWRRLTPGARVHAVGVGSSPNRTLTRGAARAGRGSEIIIGLEDDARKAAGRLLQATVRPVLTEILVEGSGLISRAPQKPRDVCASQPALIFAEIRPEGGRLQISGRMAGGSSLWIRTMDIPPQQDISGRKDICITSIPLGALFGREAIEDAEIDLAASKEQSGAIQRRIESLGLRHGISSSMTSLIAISEDATVDPRDPRRRERLAVEVPAGVSAEGVGLMPATITPGFVFTRLASYEGRQIMDGAPGAPMRRMGIGMKKRALPKIPRMMRRPPVPVLIENVRVLKLEDKILVFEFEAPVDGFLLPGENEEVHIMFDDGGLDLARVLERDSSKTGPYKAGLTIRLGLRLEGPQSWHHDKARIHWLDWIRIENQTKNVDVEIRIRLGRD